jgi:hypothetical protein
VRGFNSRARYRGSSCEIPHIRPFPRHVTRPRHASLGYWIPLARCNVISSQSQSLCANRVCVRRRCVGWRPHNLTKVFVIRDPHLRECLQERMPTRDASRDESKMRDDRVEVSRSSMSATRVLSVFRRWRRRHYRGIAASRQIRIGVACIRASRKISPRYSLT